MPPGGRVACDEGLRLWAALPMRLRYVAESMARGRASPGGLLVDTLERLADLEPKTAGAIGRQVVKVG